jgi:His-Xaa-Ser system protein HxsD
MEQSNETQVARSIVIKVDLKSYSLEAVQKVAYWFTDKCFVRLEHTSEQVLEVCLTPKTSGDTRELSGRFMNDLLDQTLREKIAKESEPLRNLIIAHALSKTSLIGQDLETTDPSSSRSA